jgi:hypothetical protein
MTIAADAGEPIANAQKTRDEWVGRLAALVDDVEKWAKELGWSTRRLETELEEPEIGKYVAPMLLLQEGTVRIQLEPIARFGVGFDGLVDLYRMPAYDDIASLSPSNGQWQIHWRTKQDNDAEEILELHPLSKNTLRDFLVRMNRNGQQA